MARPGRMLLGAVITVAVAFLGIQAIPYGRDHTNPPVRTEPRWDSAETRALAVRACFACHTNETKWPWYTSVAPISGHAQRDVVEGGACSTSPNGIVRSARLRVVEECPAR